MDMICRDDLISLIWEQRNALDLSLDYNLIKAFDTTVQIIRQLPIVKQRDGSGTVRKLIENGTTNTKVCIRSGERDLLRGTVGTIIELVKPEIMNMRVDAFEVNDDEIIVGIWEDDRK